jgi:hypothetical protein
LRLFSRRNNISSVTPGAAAIAQIASTIERRRDFEHNQSMDDNDRDPGLVFAIPDLWGPSKWLGSLDDHSSVLFSELKLDSLLIPSPYREISS